MKKIKIKNWRTLSPGQILLKVVLMIGLVLIFFALIVLFLPQTFINGFLKDRIIKYFAKSYPEYSLKIGDVNYNFLKNRIDCDSISLIKIDSTFSCAISELSIHGISWIKLSSEKHPSSNSIAKTTLDAEKIVMKFKQSQYLIRCGHLHFSLPDSEIVADSVEYLPMLTDEEFFAQSKFRNTRFRLVIPKITISGLGNSGLINGNIYRTRSINMQDCFIDIMVNMDKPYDINSQDPLMPNVGLASIKDTLRIDSLKIMNSRLNYYERYAVGQKAASVTFDKMQALAEGIVNHTGGRDTIVIHAQGNFMNTSTMKLFMLIPLGSPQFSFSYSGSLNKMEVSRLNKFLEIAEHHRIKSGTLESATYKINVNSGHASGYVNVEYKDLSVAILNKKTGSENGIFDRISSFIAKTFIIRGNNMPDKSGSMKTGIVKYTRKPDEPFVQFVWFALRSGVSNVVGF